MKSIHIIIIVVVAIFVTVLGTSLSDNLSVYTDFETAKKSGKTVHVVGSWVQRDKAHYEASQDLFSFYMQDTLQRVEMVHYRDPKPINFDQAQKVVVIGSYKDEAFEAEKIIMKCPSKFEETDITAGEKNM